MDIINVKWWTDKSLIIIIENDNDQPIINIINNQCNINDISVKKNEEANMTNIETNENDNGWRKQMAIELWPDGQWKWLAMIDDDWSQENTNEEIDWSNMPVSERLKKDNDDWWWQWNDDEPGVIMKESEENYWKPNEANMTMTKPMKKLTI